jgi:hypothetical protein
MPDLLFIAGRLCRPLFMFSIRIDLQKPVPFADPLNGLQLQ